MINCKERQLTVLSSPGYKVIWGSPLSLQRVRWETHSKVCFTGHQRFHGVLLDSLTWNTIPFSVVNFCFCWKSRGTVWVLIQLKFAFWNTSRTSAKTKYCFSVCQANRYQPFSSCSWEASCFFVFFEWLEVSPSLGKGCELTISWPISKVFGFLRLLVIPPLWPVATFLTLLY